MAFSVTRNARLSLMQVKKEPNIVIEIEGLEKLIGAMPIYKTPRYGDEDLVYGGDSGDGSPLVYGGAVLIEGQIAALSFDSTTTKIDYKLNPEKGFGSGITNIDVDLIDNRANEILAMVSAHEFLGRKVRMYMTPDYAGTNWPEDYILVFRGIIDDIRLGGGVVGLSVSHPDQKKLQATFTKYTSELDGSITNSQTTIDLVDASQFLKAITGPDLTEDPAMTFYVRIDDEIIKYTGISGNQLTGCVRGMFDTAQAAHDSGAEVGSFLRFNDNCLDIALKTMLSGWGDNWVTDIPVNSFVSIPGQPNSSSSLFTQLDLERFYGVTVGDFITTSGADNPGNNVTLQVISGITPLDNGYQIDVQGASFTLETESTAVMAFRSKYDTLPVGLKMAPDEVDVTEHERVRDLFLSGQQLDFYIKDTIDNGKEWLEQQVYAAVAAYSVPRKSRSSVAYHIGPLPNVSIPKLDETNVLQAGKIVKRRSIGKNFYNTIIYKYDEDPLEDRFKRGLVQVQATSLSTIPVGTRASVLAAKGIRQGGAVLQSTAQRRLDRYAFGAEYFSGVKLDFEIGFTIEVGDLVFLDGETLQIPSAQSGEPNTEVRIYEVISKSFDLRTGQTVLDLVDTKYDGAARYCLFSPASFIGQVISASQFYIKPSFTKPFGNNEYLKWTNFLPDFYVSVRSPDFSEAEEMQIQSINGNLITLAAPLSFTPVEGYLMEFANYDLATEQQKLVYGFWSPGDGSAGFADGEDSYVFI